MNNQESDSSGPIRPYNPGLFQGLTNRVNLIARLMLDGRVNLLIKLIPFASGIYLVFPDLVPGPVDDALLIWLSTYLFVELCPPEVVEEHEKTLNRKAETQWQTDQSPNVTVSSPGRPSRDEMRTEDIIDGEIVGDSDAPREPK